MLGINFKGEEMLILGTLPLLFYENYNVNTPPFMAGMKRYPLKNC
jgi:hypothetical protein